MRSTTDLLELELVFSQQKPLTSDKFLKEFQRRYLYSNFRFAYWEQLEELHRTGVLIPLFRFAKNRKSLLAYTHKNNLPPLSVGLGRNPSFAVCLEADKDGGYLVDPRTETYNSWYSYIREHKHNPYWLSSFFYSPYQLLLVPMLRNLASAMVVQKTRRKYSSIKAGFRLKLGERTLRDVQKTAFENAELVMALTMLETRYLPFLRGHWYSVKTTNLDWDKLLEYRNSFDPIAMLNWIDWDANRVKDTAERLLFIADSIDPLCEWSELVRLCRPEQWERLRGDALVAMDHRIAAEILLRFYEDLVQTGTAPALEPSPKYAPGPQDKRLQINLNKLDEVLMEFGISPYPSLVLILEGETEAPLVPRVMELLGIPQHKNFIKIFISKGSDKDFGLLASYIAVPNLGEPLEDDFTELTRPLTRYLVAVDAEKRFITPEKCEKERKKWIAQIHNALPKEYRTSKLQDEIDSLVSVETWNGQVFEFAHFADVEIAQAILDVYTNRQGSVNNLLSMLGVATKSELLSKLQGILQNIRPNGNIEKSVTDGWDYKPRKPEIGIALWPVLERKIKEAIIQDNLDSIPVVRVLLEAERSVAMMRRYDIGISR